MTIPLIIILVGAFCSAVGTVWLAVDQATENEKVYDRQEIKSQEIIHLQKQLFEETKTVSQLQSGESQKIIDLQEKLREENSRASKLQGEKSQRIIDIQNELTNTQRELQDAQEKAVKYSSESLNYLTGGDSYCYIKLDRGQGNTLNVSLYHVGKYPLSDLKIRITRLSALEREANGSGPRIKGLLINQAYTTTFTVGPLPHVPQYSPGPILGNSSEPIDLGVVDFEPGTEEKYMISFIAKNGMWIQVYSFTKTGSQSTSVTKDGKVLDTL